MKNLIILFSFIFAISSQLIAQTIMNIHQSNGTVLQIPLNTIDSITYTNPNPGNLATITTSNISAITGSTAVSGGIISNNGGSLVTQRGICWSTSQNPTTANNFTTNGSGSGSYSSNLTGLTANTTYYVRAYAINSAGTAYGNQISFITSSSSGIVSNPGPGLTYNGYNYSTVILGNGQEWMAENLRTTFYANGDSIPNVTDNNQWRALTTGAWVHYNNDSQYDNPYGKLYNWYAVADARKICPAGWHVPSRLEWNTFTSYLDPNADIICTPCNQSAIAGSKMKSIGTQYWTSPNIDATNESGFSGLPGGYRGAYGTFEWITVRGLWWSSTLISSINQANFSQIYNNSGSYWFSYNDIGSGFSVRCLKD